jgi:primosomal protein N' (replication factor Y) (superfamily II helicase)
VDKAPPLVTRPVRILRVALDTPLRRLFDYLPGAVSAPIGSRVRVPFGRQQLVGIVVGEAEASELPEERLKRISTVIDAEPIFDAAQLAFLGWAAEYYHHPIGTVLATALPKLLREGADAQEAISLWSATDAGRAALAAGALARAPRQRELLQSLASGPALTAAALGERLPRWREAMRSLVQQGYVARHEERLSLDVPGTPGRVATGHRLSAEQQAAYERVCAHLDRFGSFLVDGVTGSGKTEVYLRLIEATLARGRAALLLCPEIGLTPQLVARVQERFDAPLAALHSGLTDRERLAAWRAASRGAARIVIGTRSAVFAPLPELGLIIVDEEHDASFKQHEGGFHYHARDLAVVRAQRAGIPVVLGSATPSFESLHNVALGKTVSLPLPRRAGAAEPPRLQLIDLRAHAQHKGLSAPLASAIERHLAAAGQVLVFINRRGYAPALLCTGCGWTAPCRQCDARMTVHQRERRLSCHHCGAESPLPERCPRCGHDLRPLGHGTERVEETLAGRFPGYPIARFDRDSVRHSADLEAAIDRVTSGEARILVGTQMLTKGHHFPDVTLVGVLNADQSLFSTDFRAAERLAQTIIQVAGRAGRAARPGEVLLQSEFPQHPLLQALLAEGYAGFARQALAERAAAHWPPFSRLALLRASGLAPAAALEFLTRARALAGQPRGVQLRGPVPAAMVRRAGRHHAQLLLESEDRAALQRLLGAWLPRVEQLPAARGLRWTLDVDPLEVF